MHIEGKVWPPLIGIQDGEYKLERTLNALAVLGNPHMHLNNVIHVAGTNGKGSNVSFIKNILNIHGYTTNVYTSPHLVKINERIQIHSLDISDESLQQYTEEVYFMLKEYALDDTLTYFEGLTVIALYVFAKKHADFNIIEVGLGGRFDATNVITNALISVITSISMDHQDYLGNTLELIAKEKAEIIKMNSMAAIGWQSDKNLYNIFKRKAESVHTQYRFCMELKSISPKIDISYQKQNANLSMLAIEMIGKKLGIDFDYTKSINAINQTCWIGRLQRFFVRSINRDITMDCAHNIDGITAFLEYITKNEGFPILICGMLKRKVTPEIVNLIRSFLDRNPVAQMMIINFDGFEECLPSDEFANAINHERCLNAEDFTSALNLATNDQTIYICGSIHLIGYCMQKTI